FGGIDLQVTSAGIPHRGTCAEAGLGVFRRVMAVTFFGAVHCSRAALPSLLERRGQIVVLGSLTGFAPLLYRSAYNARKHALN
ncbi:SDR family NAD(P)-dependent oxidoreductase, partial [Pseudomonas aeruginosa]|uniref:SDR family NAD(P)-dependent oxidoreductase n=1 Tax=Pseudomonas aeruginosa TaxID=287 RepID=UPI0024AFCDF8